MHGPSRLQAGPKLRQPVVAHRQNDADLAQRAPVLVQRRGQGLALGQAAKQARHGAVAVLGAGGDSVAEVDHQRHRAGRRPHRAHQARRAAQDEQRGGVDEPRCEGALGVARDLGRQAHGDHRPAPGRVGTGSVAGEEPRHRGAVPLAPPPGMEGAARGIPKAEGPHQGLLVPAGGAGGEMGVDVHPADLASDGAGPADARALARPHHPGGGDARSGTVRGGDGEARVKEGDGVVDHAEKAHAFAGRHCLGGKERAVGPRTLHRHRRAVHRIGPHDPLHVVAQSAKKRVELLHVHDLRPRLEAARTRDRPLTGGGSDDRG